MVIGVIGVIGVQSQGASAGGWAGKPRLSGRAAGGQGASAGGQAAFELRVRVERTGCPTAGPVTLCQLLLEPVSAGLHGVWLQG